MFFKSKISSNLRPASFYKPLREKKKMPSNKLWLVINFMTQLESRDVKVLKNQYNVFNEVFQ